jgi:hypothetical protein
VLSVGISPVSPVEIMGVAPPPPRICACSGIVRRYDRGPARRRLEECVVELLEYLSGGDPSPLCCRNSPQARNDSYHRDRNDL